jgi:hypothetical protein
MGLGLLVYSFSFSPSFRLFFINITYLKLTFFPSEVSEKVGEETLPGRVGCYPHPN